MAVPQDKRTGHGSGSRSADSSTMPFDAADVMPKGMVIDSLATGSGSSRRLHRVGCLNTALCRFGEPGGSDG
jgi:hypothetical protein